MAIKPCKECGGPVSDEAKTCPRCGAKLQPKTTKVVWFAAIVMFAVVLPKCFIDTAEEASPQVVSTQPVVAIQTGSQPVKKGYADQSDLDITDFLICTAATLKTGPVEKYVKWADALNARYTRIFPDKTKQQVQDYTNERVLDKRDYLERKGIVSKPANEDFYKKNCEASEPK